MIARVSATAVTGLCVLLSACGSLSKDELGRGVDTVTSISAEGRLLSDDVARDRTKLTFARVHARELSEDATHESERLGDADVDAGLDDERDTAVDYAEAVSDALGTLSVHAGDEAQGRLARRTLARLNAKLTALGKRV